MTPAVDVGDLKRLEADLWLGQSWDHACWGVVGSRIRDKSRILKPNSLHSAQRSSWSTLVLLLTCFTNTSTATAQSSATTRSFSVVARLSNARLAHTATLLPDGRVLIAGGGQGPDLIDGFWVVPQTELFDPASSSFQPAGISAHDCHTATLLQSGQVLLVGGESTPFGVTTAADLYDPGTITFKQTGSLAVERECHTATLLSDGRVLIAGGVTGNGFRWEALHSAEIYDPVAGSFSTTGSLNEGRYGATATLLADGRVLITGGSNQRRLNSAEIYDPETGAFTLTGNMEFERSDHTATALPNGQVVVIGGQPDAATNAEVYDPASGMFTSVGSMITPRMWHTASLLADGTVLVVGGWAHGALSSVELYDPASGSFARGPDLREARFWHSATVLPDGSVLVVGGAGSNDGIELDMKDSAEVFR